MKAALFSILFLFSCAYGMEEHKKFVVTTSTSTSSRPTQKQFGIDYQSHIISSDKEQQEHCCTILGRILYNAPALLMYAPVLAFDAALSKLSKND